MDPAGWAPIADVLELLRIDRAVLDRLVAENDKRRLQIADGRVRACQGHSKENMPVTQEGLEASWDAYQGGQRVWHGTGLEALEAIGRNGLQPVSRTHVHLAEAVESTVGKRSKVQVMLAVSVALMTRAALPLWRAPNGVILTRWVPPDCIEGALAMSRKAKAKARHGLGPFLWLP